MSQEKLETASSQQDKLGVALVKETILVFFRNILPILFIVLLIAVPTEIIKNYYFVPWDYEESFFRSIRRDGVVNTIFLSLITPSIIYYVFQKLQNNHVTISSALWTGFKKWPKVIGYGFLKNLIVFAGLIFLIIPGLIFLIRLMFVFVIITVEGTTNIDPIGKSNLISKGNFWKMAYCTIILILILAIPNFTIAILVELFLDGWIANSLIDLILDISSVFFIILALLLYKRLNEGQM
jgi:hypothetical protein